MIDKVGIKNYKSIVDLEIELGKVNVIVGANGSGKTNILEAIALASAANQGKLDKEHLGARIRLAEPEFMRSEFDEMPEDLMGEGNTESNVIYIESYENNGTSKTFSLLYYSEEDGDWVDIGEDLRKDEIAQYIKRVFQGEDLDKMKKVAAIAMIEEGLKDARSFIDNINKSDVDIKDILPKYISKVNEKLFFKPQLSSFLIYSPEESNLRKFSDDTMIRPLGRRGEGLFKHLKELITDEENSKEIMKALNEGLSLLDWFKEFDIPTDLFTGEQRLNISDRFLKESKQIFDQNSTNEGFLFLLFYLTLFNSPKTPAFFAIDNIENALNPKLARKLITHLIEVAKKRDKQVIFTTHSPYVLDGLDLSDDEQRLFVVRRNIDGHTKISRVRYRENRKMPLSELWMSGALGGLPDNF